MKYGVFFRFCPSLEIKNWAKNNVKISFAPSILILPPPGKNPADSHEVNPSRHGQNGKTKEFRKIFS